MKNNIIIFLTLLLAACSGKPKDATDVSRLPDIFPDYAGVTIPAQIAPMNFNVNDPDAECVYVEVTGANGGKLETCGRLADFDEDDWHALTERNVGKDLTFDVYVKNKKGEWRRYLPFTMHVSESPLTDWGVVYRKIAPGYQTFSKTGIYQRDLSTFEESPVLEETAVGGQCINCHYSNRGRADQFSIHVRGSHGGTILQNGDQLSVLSTKCPVTKGNATYGYWHPDGRYVAYSVNRIVQNFHLDKGGNIEPWDVFSDIMVLDTKSNTVITSPLVETPNCETTPAFSPDGKTLYFCYADSVTMPAGYEQLKYSLCSIQFDARKGEFGNRIDTLINAVSIGRSVSLPRPSYDGRYVMFNLTDHGTSPIHHADADLWMLDLATGESRPLNEVNSEYSDAYHNWSADGNGWFLFNSKRIDGMYGNLYISRIGSDGRATKPFLLPQKDPRRYYSDALHSFNAPDFIASRVSLDLSAATSSLMSGSLTPVIPK